MKNKAIGAALTVITLVIVAAAASFAITRLMGGGVYTIVSGSMEPEYRVGSLIYVMPAKPEELKKGDVITFVMADDVTVTHRIVRVLGDGGSGLRFVTKGDANDTEDAEKVRPENVLGKPVFRIPLAGHLVERMKTPPGLYIALAAAAILIAAGIIPHIIKRHQGGKQ